LWWWLWWWWRSGGGGGGLGHCPLPLRTGHCDAPVRITKHRIAQVRACASRGNLKSTAAPPRHFTTEQRNYTGTGHTHGAPQRGRPPRRAEMTRTPRSQSARAQTGAAHFHAAPSSPSPQTPLRDAAISQTKQRVANDTLPPGAAEQQPRAKHCVQHSVARVHLPRFGHVNTPKCNANARAIIRRGIRPDARRAAQAHEHACTSNKQTNKCHVLMYRCGRAPVNTSP
jgi:hypothetical protein